MSEKIFTRINIIKDNDVIGLGDMIIDGKYIFSVDVISNKADIFQLSKKVKFDNIDVKSIR